MSAKTIQYVAVHDGDPAEAAEDAKKLRALPGVRVVEEREGSVLLLLEREGEGDFPALAREAGPWIVAKRRTYRLL
jgi:hypothetical protein